MLKDSLLFGQYDYKVDNKGRIFLPSSSEREEGDSVALVHDPVLDMLELYPAASLAKRIEAINQLILAANTIEEQRRYKALQLEVCKSILKYCKVDCQGRILLSGHVTPGEDITLIGINDHYILERKKNV